MGLYVSNLVHGVPSGVESELVHNYLYLAPLLRYHGPKVQYADVGLQPERSCLEIFFKLRESHLHVL